MQYTFAHNTVFLLGRGVCLMMLYIAFKNQNMKLQCSVFAHLESTVIEDTSIPYPENFEAFGALQANLAVC